MLGGGSNLLIADQGFPGTVVRVATRGITADVSDCSGATVTVAAGEDWDALVATAVEQEWSGIEALSGIPGLVGGTPIQNVGAYGSEVAQTIARVRTFDRSTGRQVELLGRGLRLRLPHLAVQGRARSLPRARGDLPVHPRLAVGADPVRRAGPHPRRAGGHAGARGRRTPGRARSAGRQGDGAGRGRPRHLERRLVLHQPDPGPGERPRACRPTRRAIPQPDGRVKTSAAWLIEHAGFGKGFGAELGAGRATLSSKHTLALTNRGGATADDLLTLAREVRAGVQQAFGVTLVEEPVLVECTL